MSDIEVGQVLSLKIRFNNSGSISSINHPYLVVGVDRELSTIEIAQMDSLEGKEYKAAFRSNKTILRTEPDETVMDKDSYIQMDNTLKVQNYAGLGRYRRQEDKLSEEKLRDAVSCYYNYHDKNEIDENKQVYIDKEELERLNA